MMDEVALRFSKASLCFQASSLVVVWLSQRQGLYQVKVSQAVAECGSLDLVIKLQGFSGQRIN